ncbi:MAG: cytochrome C [Pseudomonadota bacterium]
MHTFTLSVVSLVGGLAMLGAAASDVTADLPEGPGRDLVEGFCTGCHNTNLIERSSGYSQDEWKALIATMIDLKAVPEDEDTISSYLAQHFAPNDHRAPTLVPGDTEIAFEEWVVPTLGQRSRDPAEAPDGSIWWAGQYGNMIGRIDTETGAMTEYMLPANAHPHTVIVDETGNVWYTGNKNASLGVLDPETEAITVYDMPDPAARDPHSGIVDERGRLFFTVQHGNFIGRLDTATGDVVLAEVATPNARPYGIKLDHDGVPWVSCNGSNCLIKVDPETMELTEIDLPDADARSRRLDIASDGTIWYVNSSLGRLGHYDPKSGVFREWDSPSGPSSHPYAIAIIDDIVWYNESGMRPDVLVRFDPATETFQSWAIPSGDVYAGIVRHMRPTADGDLLIHQSSTNRILRVTEMPGDGDN